MRLSFLLFMRGRQRALALLVLSFANLLVDNRLEAAESGRSCDRSVASSISSLAIHPQNPAILYAGTSDDGVFKSTDSGATWRAINTGLPDGSSVNALTIDPQTPETLYAYAGRQAGFGGKWQGSLFKSTDAGASWQPINSVGIPDDSSLSTLAIDPQAPTTLYGYTWGPKRQPVDLLLQSIDGGATWHTIRPQQRVTTFGSDGSATEHIVNTDLPTGGIKTLMVDPHRSAVLYAGGNRGVFKSADSGKTWEAMIGGVTSAGERSLSVTALAMDPEAFTTFYAQAGEGMGSQAIWGSSLFKGVVGGQWQEIGSGPPTLPLHHSVVHTLAVVPQTPATLHGGMRSRILFARSGAVAPQPPAALYGGTDAGLFKSIDGGISWQASHTGLVGITAGDLVVDPKTPTTLYGVTRGKVFKSDNGGTSWQALVTADLTGHVCGLALDPQTPTTMYAWTLTGLFKSIDGGTNWQASNVDQHHVSLIDTLIVDPQTPTTLYVGIDGFWGGNSGVFKSIDGGATWEQRDYGLIDQDILALVINPQTPTTLYAMARRSCTHKSTDAGKTWEGINDCTGSNPGFIFAIDPQNPAILYGGNYADSGIVKSTDGGTTWRLSGSGLPASVNINALVIDPKTPTVLYARTSHGVFKSTNGGGTWEAINAGLSGTSVSDLALDPQTPTTLYVWTRGGGVFKSSDGGTTWRTASTGLF